MDQAPSAPPADPLPPPRFTLFERIVLVILLYMWSPRGDLDNYLHAAIRKLIGLDADVKRWLEGP